MLPSHCTPTTGADQARWRSFDPRTRQTALAMLPLVAKGEVVGLHRQPRATARPSTNSAQMTLALHVRGRGRHGARERAPARGAAPSGIPRRPDPPRQPRPVHRPAESRLARVERGPPASRSCSPTSTASSPSTTSSAMCAATTSCSRSPTGCAACVRARTPSPGWVATSSRCCSRTSADRRRGGACGPPDGGGHRGADALG